MRASCAQALEKSAIAYELVVNTNGERAIQFIDDIDSRSGLSPQLAIVDLDLPKKPGAEVVKKMRQARCVKAYGEVLNDSGLYVLPRIEMNLRVVWGLPASAKAPTSSADFCQCRGVAVFPLV
jgi:CheY-like chemotaxis protein